MSRLQIEDEINVAAGQPPAALDEFDKRSLALILWLAGSILFAIYVVCKARQYRRRESVRRALRKRD